MTDRLRIALHQANPTVGDIEGNVRRVQAARAQAAAQGADLMVGTELGLIGYPPEDLVLRASVLEATRAAVDALAAVTADGGPALLVGTPWRTDGGRANAAVLLDQGRIQAVTLKHRLPNYGVFDEIRVFEPGPLPRPLSFRGISLGVMICEDLWFSDSADALARAGADLLVVPNGSPYDLGKAPQRLAVAQARVAETGLPLLYVNQVGGQDELVFDGASFVLDATGEVVAGAPAWKESVVITDWTRAPSGRWTCQPQTPPAAPGRWEEIYQALMVGLRDYVDKNGFPGVLLGLSGGIDSALSAALAADALGAERVHAVMMPSPYTSVESLEDAEQCARLLGVSLDTIDIGPAMAAFSTMLAPSFGARAPDLTEENIQSRARGVTLMALSNKLGPMVLSTGNKSEMSVGYATLYGDMCGGFAILKDVYKTSVFALSRWRNAHRPHGALGPMGPVMPDRVITKPPSAELRPDQKDEDSLPPYSQLDAVLQLLIEEQCGVAEATRRSGLPRALVERVWTLLGRAEYKRRQAPPGVKITALAFGRDRRYPITNAYPG
ncbi:NAD+ synthase [Pararhodospirillum oryzae]|uniref:Glutamine-dependent NAD(+) synthetase n=1 Tax=Pararhodospirillum oryzae TaxID=478448 RepID=A0A512H5H5_9PROT|nr:NAD+ synthase [Pararhodospirillum oryzae]GEO80726.1 NAD+ synthase [Pararhodospirillum oryzae]